jgi:hypothetical protein
MDRQCLRFQLEVERDRHPIEGRLTDEHGHTVAFTGWLEFIPVLETRLSATVPSHGAPAPDALAPGELD